MKQIKKTPKILEHLRQSVGPDVNLDNLAVYEAIALNNRPLRKNHPLYNGSVADRSLLLEMAAALSIESRPLQIQHSHDDLPSGRAFHGEVVDRGNETQLRVLFFIDNKEEKLISKLDSGTVDQVSVSVLPKKIINSKSGFDYLSAEATAKNIWTGTDNDGNTLGKDGVYGRMVGLNQWMELSLVGMGGADGAFIVSRDKSYFGSDSEFEKLAASGVDPSVFVLEASTENDMPDNLTELVDKLTENAVSLSNAQSEVTTLKATNAAQAAQITELTAQLDAASGPAAVSAAALTAANEKLTATEADLTAAVTALQSVAKTILVASGKMNETVPATVAELNTLITESSAKLATALAANGGVAEDPVDDVTSTNPAVNLAAYRRPARRS